ncbi:amidase [Mesorhizobium sp. SB112]|uniref:amidase n=2 Tax=Pseudomonadota TaxID=1224 RepID=UPI003266BAD1
MQPMRDELNAFLDLPDRPVKSAEFGPLADMLLAVKDIYDVKGYPTGCGNPMKAGGESLRSAPSVESLLNAGALFAGKTQTDELAFSLMGLNAHFPPPINSAAPDRVTGGSSSGSAAAIAGALADIALGSDTGGSIRAPASFCGLVGLRTTQGRIPLDGIMPLSPSLDTVGWFSRDIGTYEKVGEVLLGPDKGQKIPQRLLFAEVLDALVLGPEEEAEYHAMRNLVCEALGMKPDAAKINASVDELYWSFRRIQGFEAWQSHGEWISGADRNLGPGVKERFEYGSTIKSADAAEETKKRDLFREKLADLLADDGILILPTVPGAAPLKDGSSDEMQAYRERALRLLCWSGLSGFPQITIPLGMVQGAPFGISLLGPKDSDMALIRLAATILDRAEKA